MKRLIKQLSTPIRTLQSCLSVVDDIIWDAKYKLDTRSEVAIQDLDISSDEKKHADKYKPTRTRYFRKLIQHLKPDLNGVFVDVGCGKGRILILAAMFGFKEVRGIEISNQLSNISSKNIETFRARFEKAFCVEVLCLSVLDYHFRHDETFVFLYSPFDYTITERFLCKLEESIAKSPREVTLVINEFRFPELMNKSQVFQLSERFRYGAADFHIYSNAL